MGKEKDKFEFRGNPFAMVCQTDQFFLIVNSMETLTELHPFPYRLDELWGGRNGE